MIRKKLIVGNHINYARKGAPLFTALAGTLDVTNGSTALVGHGTTFTGLTVGQALSILGVAFTVGAIADDTHLTLSAEWTGDTTAGASGFKGVAGASTSSANKPATNVTANWTNIGSTLDLEPKNKRDEEEIWDPSPGAYEVSDVMVKSRSLNLDATVQEGGPELFEMLFLNSGAITDDYAPMSGSGQLYAWWQVKQYDQDNNLINLLEFWGIGTVDAQKFDKNVVRYKLSLRVLANALNNGVLSLA